MMRSKLNAPGAKRSGMDIDGKAEDRVEKPVTD